MKKRNRILLAGLLVLALGSFMWLVLCPHEPVYRGKRLSQWLDEYNRAGGMDKTESTSNAIRAMGTNSLPFLLAHIKHTDSALKNRFFYEIANNRLVKFRMYGPDPYRAASILALNALGSNAAPVCPELLKIAGNADDPRSLWWGTQALLAIGPAAIPTLAKLCNSTNKNVRDDAVLMIATMKAAPSPRFSALVWSWTQHYPEVNVRPTITLRHFVTVEANQELVHLLEDPDPAVRRASAEAISNYYMIPAYNQATKSAIGLLIKSLNDADTQVRLSAGQTLKVIDPAAAAKAGVK